MRPSAGRIWAIEFRGPPAVRLLPSPSGSQAAPATRPPLHGPVSHTGSYSSLMRMLRKKTSAP